MSHEIYYNNLVKLFEFHGKDVNKFLDDLKYVYPNIIIEKTLTGHKFVIPVNDDTGIFYIENGELHGWKKQF